MCYISAQRKAGLHLVDPFLQNSEIVWVFEALSPTTVTRWPTKVGNTLYNFADTYNLNVLI